MKNFKNKNNINYVGVKKNVEIVAIIILTIFIVFFLIIKCKSLAFLFITVVLCLLLNKIKKSANKINYTLYNYIKLKSKIYFLIYHQIWLFIFSIIINIFLVNFITGSLFDYEILIAYASNDDNKRIKKIDDIIINIGRNINSVINQDQVQNTNNNNDVTFIANITDDRNKLLDLYISILDWNIIETNTDDESIIKDLKQRLIDQNFYINELYNEISNNLLLNNLFNNNIGFVYTIEDWKQEMQDIDKDYFILMRKVNQFLCNEIMVEDEIIDIIQSMEDFLIDCDNKVIYGLEFYIKQDYVTQHRSFYDVIIELNHIKKYLYIINQNYIYYNENFYLDSRSFYTYKLIKFNLMFNDFYIRLNDRYIKFLSTHKFEN